MSRTKPYTVSIISQDFITLYEKGLKEQIEAVLRKLIGAGKKYFCVDMEWGASLYAAEILFKLKKEFKDIKIVAVDAKDYIKQIKNQDDDVWICDVETFEPVSRYVFALLHTNVKMNSDLYHSVESEKTEDSTMNRDKWMINKSSTLLVIADRKIVKEKAESINYALKRGCEVCYLCESS